jgi:delta 1-pyrroline-5-carboxylate dehydrogenase
MAIVLDAAKYIIEKVVKPCEKRRIIGEHRVEQPKDIDKAFRITHFSWSSLHYQSVKSDAYLIERLQLLACAHPIEVFWKLLWSFTQ